MIESRSCDMHTKIIKDSHTEKMFQIEKHEENEHKSQRHFKYSGSTPTHKHAFSFLQSIFQALGRCVKKTGREIKSSKLNDLCKEVPDGGELGQQGGNKNNG
jgi:hypothetical protein